MPLLGSYIGSFIIANFISDPDILVAIIFTVLSIEMLLSIKDLDQNTKEFKNILEALFFAFSVSIDSFTVGIALGSGEENVVTAGLIFAFLSGLFTFCGLNIGTKLSLKFGKLANVIGSILLLILAIAHFFE